MDSDFSASDIAAMQRAICLAQEAADAGEVPIGAVITHEDRIIGEGRNHMEELQCATAHAELQAIKAACAARDTWRLDHTTLYVTLEPCPMCAGAILNSRIARVVYAARDHRLGACDSHFGILANNPIGRVVQVQDGLFAEECKGMLRTFFKELRSGTRVPSRVRRLSRSLTPEN